MKFLLIAGFADSLIGFRKPLIVALLNKGLEVHVAAPELLANHTVMSELADLGVVAHNIPMQRTGMNPLADVYTLSALWKLMRELKPDYVLGYTIKPVIYGTLAAWLSRVPQRFALITGLGFAFMGEDGNQRSRVRALVQGLYRSALCHCQTVFFQNPDDEALFRQLKIISARANTCVVNGSGVDISEYAVAPLPTIDDVPTARFLLIARLLGDKGIREYAQAAAIVKAKYPQVQFDLVGWIDDNPNAIQQHELDSWVNEGVFNFLGRLADVQPAIAACSVYVLPSYREGTPRTVLEAMAMGRAVITTDAPGCRETVIDGYNGYLVPVKAVDELATAMEKFILNPEFIVSMGAASRTLAEKKFDVHSVNQAMLQAMGL
jgi:glycosyltransferase involved in cell wall biosynthesis